MNKEVSAAGENAAKKVSRSSFTNSSRIFWYMVAGAILVTVGVAGFLAGSANDTSVSDSAEESRRSRRSSAIAPGDIVVERDAPASAELPAGTEGEELCDTSIVSYTNEYYPSFILNYDECYWELSEDETVALGTIRPVNTVVTLEDEFGNEMVFNFDVMTLFDLIGGPYCGTEPVESIVTVGQIARIKEAANSFYYRSGVALEGSPEFSELLLERATDPFGPEPEGEFEFPEPAGETYCHYPGPGFSMTSSLTASEAGVLDLMGADVDLYVWLDVTANTVDEAPATLDVVDTIIVNMETDAS